LVRDFSQESISFEANHAVDCQLWRNSPSSSASGKAKDKGASNSKKHDPKAKTKKEKKEKKDKKASMSPLGLQYDFLWEPCVV
jgi:hypothetical protein